MGTTASGFVYPDASNTLNWRQSIKDAMDSVESVVTATRGFRFFKVANNSALTALASSYTLVEGVDFARRTDNKVTYRYNGSAWKEWESDWFNESNPTVNAQSGSFTSVSATLRAKWTAGTYQYSAIVTITTAGTAAGYLGIPMPITAARYHVGLAYESAVLANNGVGVIASGGSTLLVRKYDGTTLIGSSRTVNVTGTIEV